MCISLLYNGKVAEFLREADLGVLRFLNVRPDNILKPLLEVLSDTTSVLAYGMPAALLLAAAVRKRRDHLWRAVWSFGIVFVADYLTLLLKHLVQRRRPYEVYRDIILGTDGGNSSFPSGHTAQAFAMAVGIALLFPSRTRGPVLLCWATAVGLSRICLGAHYPSDVLGAAMLATFTAWSVWVLLARFTRA